MQRLTPLDLLQDCEMIWQNKRGQSKWHFGVDQSVWRDGEKNGFAILVRGAKEKCRGRRMKSAADAG